MSRNTASVAILVGIISLVAILVGRSSQGPDLKSNKELRSVRISMAPYPDTCLYLYGKEKGIFAKYGLDPHPVDCNWGDQIEVTAGGGTDIAMATVDELAAKSKSLDQIGKSVVYFFPAWYFTGLKFVSQPNIRSLDELRSKYPDREAKQQFLKQLKDKLIAFPEGSCYDQAIRRFIISAGQRPEGFKFVNTPVEAGINGLGDKTVGIAAVGIFEYPEALRRGYKTALRSCDFDTATITGFICTNEFYKHNKQLLQAFASSWYETVPDALSHQEETYRIMKKYLDQRGTKFTTMKDFDVSLSNNVFPLNSSSSYRLFTQEHSPACWKKAWANTMQNLRDSGKADQTSTSTDDFVVDQFLQDHMKTGTNKPAYAFLSKSDFAMNLSPTEPKQY